MNIWTAELWRKKTDVPWGDVRSGLRFRFDKNIHEEVRAACLDFGKWLRSEYRFPMRVPVYVKSTVRLKCMDGDLACGTFFGPFDHTLEPYIRLAAGDYPVLREKLGRDRALDEILTSLAHELTHYFQWLNQIRLTETGEERQAKRYSQMIMGRYAEAGREPPESRKA